MRLLLVFVILCQKSVTCCPQNFCECSLDSYTWRCFNVSSSEQIRGPKSREVHRLYLEGAVFGPGWSFHEFPKLKMLDVLSSTFDDYEGSLFDSLPKSTEIRLFRNQIRCGHNLITMIRSRNFSTMKESYCWPLNLISISDYLDSVIKVESQCPPLCRCVLLEPMKGINSQTTELNVDCSRDVSGGLLKQLPESLPDDWAISLNLRGNQISDLRPVIDNYILYKRVKMMNLQDNHVNNIDLLRNSPWLQGILYLNLAGNHIQSFDPQIFDGLSFQYIENERQATILLSRNPWKCDCKSFIDLQEFLHRGSIFVADKSSVQCSSGDVVIKQRVDVMCSHSDVIWVSVYHCVSFVIIGVSLVIVTRSCTVIWMDLSLRFLHFQPV